MSKTDHHGKHSPQWRWKLYGGYSQTPSWWLKLHMTRPRRPRDKRLIDRVMRDEIDAENAAYDVGARKPHVYYW